MTVNKFPVKRLEKIEFASALRKGQGRAMLHVLRYGLEDVEGLILEACLHNQVYDQQLESGRGDWLFSMFRDTPQFPKFREAILNAVKIETGNFDVFQLAHLASEFAELGDEEARHVLRERVYQLAADPNAEDWTEVQFLIALEGAAGFLQLARLYGQRLLADPNDDVTDLSYGYEEHSDYRELLKEYSAKEAAIHAYQEYLERQEEKRSTDKLLDVDHKQKNHERVRKKYTLQGILNDAKNAVGNLPGRYLTFGRHASAEELEQVYSALMGETKESVRTRLLWVFRQSKLPHLDEVIFDWAIGANDELRAAAIGALAQISDERVHHLARMKMEAGSLVGADHEVLGLFLENYSTEDAALIIRCLTGLRAIPEDMHELSYDLIELAEKYEDPGLADGILWVYENTPCGYCRYESVKWLSRFHLFTDALRYECQHDSHSDTREFAGKKEMDGYA